MGDNNQLQPSSQVDRNDYRVVVLNENNYVTWKWQMELILTSKDLMPCIAGVSTNERKNHEAASILAASISTLNMQRVVNCKTAKEIWNALEATYENKSSSEKTALMEKLTSYKIQTIKDISKGIGELQAIAAKLKSMGSTVDNDFLISIILKALPSAMDTWKSTWKMVNAEKPNLNKLITGIMAEINDMKDPENLALLSRHKKQLSKAKRNGKDSRLDKSKSSESKEQTRRKDRDRCWYCKKRGHWARDCQVRKADEERSDEDEDNDDDSDEDVDDEEESYVRRRYVM